MKIATSTTITGILICVLLSAVLGLWAERRFSKSMETIAVNTTLFLGHQIEAVLHEPLVDALLTRKGRKELTKTLGSAAERSIALLSIDVVNADGEVIASDDDNLLGTKQTAAEEVFAEGRTATVLRIDRDYFENRRTRLAVPLLRRGDLKGYLSLLVKHDQIEGLYNTLYATMTTIVLCALVGVLLLGAMLHIQLSRLGTRLTASIDSVLDDEDEPAPIAISDDFAGVQQAAMRVGAQLKAARGEAKSARSELNMLASVTKVGVVLLDVDGEPIYITDPAMDLLAQGDPECLRERLQELKPTIEDAQSQLKSHPTMPISKEVSFPSGRAGTLHLEFLSLNEQEWRGCLVIIKDRALMEALETDLQAATRLRGLNTLYLGATHDIRSPLNAINMNLELLSQGLSDNTEFAPERLRHYSNVVKEELERLQRRLEALLRHAAPLDDDQQECELVETINSLLQLLEPQARAQRVTLQTNLPQPPIYVSMPASQIRQAFMNLMVNSIEAMPNGGELTVAAAASNGDVKVTIDDSGPGIPGQLARQIFDMHFTTKSTGTGIGLYVVREIVERHGGKITVTSELGAGTCATVQLPIAEQRVTASIGPHHAK